MAGVTRIPDKYKDKIKPGKSLDKKKWENELLKDKLIMFIIFKL